MRFWAKPRSGSAGLPASGRASGEEENPLSSALLVEIRVGGLGLVEPIAIGEQRIDIDSALDDENGASRLVPYRHAPGRHDRDLLAEKRPYVECDLRAEADERRRSPRLYGVQ